MPQQATVPLAAPSNPVATATLTPAPPAQAQTKPVQPSTTAGGVNPILIAVIGAAGGAVLLLVCVVVVMQFLGDKPPPPGPVATRPQHGFPPAHFGPSPSHHASQPPANWPPSRPNPFPPASSARPPTTSSTHLPKTVVFTSPGQFSIAAPVGWRWEDLGSKPLGGMPSRGFRAKTTPPLGTISVKVVEIPQADNEQRLGFVEGTKLQLSNPDHLKDTRLIGLKGLDLTGRIPDIVNYSYVLQDDVTRAECRGRIIFGKKRVSMLSVSSFDRVNDQLIHSCLATFREL